MDNAKIFRRCERRENETAGIYPGRRSSLSKQMGHRILLELISGDASDHEEWKT